MYLRRYLASVLDLQTKVVLQFVGFDVDVQLLPLVFAFLNIDVASNPVEKKQII